MIKYFIFIVLIIIILLIINNKIISKFEQNPFNDVSKVIDIGKWLYGKSIDTITDYMNCNKLTQEECKNKCSWNDNNSKCELI